MQLSTLYDGFPLKEDSRVIRQTRNRRLNADNAGDPCMAHQDCTQCTEAWPLCAWCGSASSCRSAPKELQSRDTESQSIHVIYSLAEYRTTYGNISHLPDVVHENTCGVWLFKPSSCGHVEMYCSPFQTCSACTAVGGCGYCHGGHGGMPGRCMPGTVNGAISMTVPHQVCGAAQENVLGSSGAQHNGTWIFGNWTKYYAGGEWETSCVEECQGGSQLTGRIGQLRIGNPKAHVSYADSSSCIWAISPSHWPTGMELRLYLQFHSLAGRGDILSVNEILRSPDGSIRAGREVVYAGCARSLRQQCIMLNQVAVSYPVAIKFVSQPRAEGRAWRGASWQLDWHLVETPLRSEKSFGTGMDTFVWFGISMLLVPILATLAFIRWRWRQSGLQHFRERTNIVGAIALEGRSGEGVDIETLERHVPSCRPCVIGARGISDPEAMCKGMCSVCLGELEAGEEARQLPCGHNFHKRCIDVWLGRSCVCPMCRRQVLAIGIRPIPAVPSTPTAGSSTAAHLENNEAHQVEALAMERPEAVPWSLREIVSRETPDGVETEAVPIPAPVSSTTRSLQQSFPRTTATQS